MDVPVLEHCGVEERSHSIDSKPDPPRSVDNEALENGDGITLHHVLAVRREGLELEQRHQGDVATAVTAGVVVLLLSGGDVATAVTPGSIVLS